MPMVNTFQPRENSGALFRNVRKSKDTHPDFTGECVIGGVEYRISGWARESKAGNRYTSLAFTRADQVPVKAKPIPATGPQAKPREPGEDDDKQEDIPW